MKQKQYTIKKSNELIEATVSFPTIDAYRIVLTSISIVCANLYYNKKNALTASIKTEELKKLFPAFKKAGSRIHKIIDEATDQIGKNNIVNIWNKNEGNFRKVSFISEMIYKDFNELTIHFNKDIEPYFNAKSKYTKYLLNNTTKLTSYQQVRLYELCYQYVKTGTRTIELKQLKAFTDTTNKSNTSYIKQLNTCIKKINQKTNLNIIFKTIKTSRKITHVIFNINRNDVHPLESTIKKGNTLRTDLISLGFNENNIKHLSIIPSEILIKSIEATKKKKHFQKSAASYFFGVINNLKKEESSPLKPHEVVHVYKKTLGMQICVKHWKEFFNQLSEKDKTTYSNNFDNQDSTVRKAVIKEFESKFNKWLYCEKINLTNEVKK